MPPKYYPLRRASRGSAMVAASVLARALAANTAAQYAQAAQLRRRALLRRAFNRWRVVTNRRSMRTDAYGRSIVRLAMSRRWRR